MTLTPFERPKSIAEGLPYSFYTTRFNYIEEFSAVHSLCAPSPVASLHLHCVRRGWINPAPCSRVEEKDCAMGSNPARRLI